MHLEFKIRNILLDSIWDDLEALGLAKSVGLVNNCQRTRDFLRNGPLEANPFNIWKNVLPTNFPDEGRRENNWKNIFLIKLHSQCFIGPTFKENKAFKSAEACKMDHLKTGDWKRLSGLRVRAGF